MAYVGNVVDLWERLAEENIRVDLGSDQTSLHNPWAGGYYPVGISFEESKRMMAEEPEKFKEKRAGVVASSGGSHQQTNCQRHVLL